MQKFVMGMCIVSLVGAGSAVKTDLTFRIVIFLAGLVLLVGIAILKALPEDEDK